MNKEIIEIIKILPDNISYKKIDNAFTVYLDNKKGVRLYKYRKKADRDFTKPYEFVTNNFKELKKAIEEALR